MALSFSPQIGRRQPSVTEVLPPLPVSIRCGQEAVTRRSTLLTVMRTEANTASPWFAHHKSMLPFDFIIPRRPLSHSARNSANKVEWKAFVHSQASAGWIGQAISSGSLRFTLVYLCQEEPPDINNIIKPVQDALIGLVYADDALIVDVQGHLRMINAPIDVTGLPLALLGAIQTGADCVYVRIAPSSELNQLL